jgi:transcriptional regulator with XRE-family HTH domain
LQLGGSQDKLPENEADMRHRKYDHRRLAYLMTKDSLTYRALARNIALIVSQEVTATTVRRHIIGESEPNAKYLAAYADFFSVPIDYFFGGIGG